MLILKQSELDGMPCPDTLIHGECLETMKHIADGSIDAIIADLPYGTTACKWDTVIPFAPLWEAYKRIIKPNGAIVLTAAQPFTSRLVCSNLEWFRYEWVWDKVNLYTGALRSKKQPLRRHENILVFYNKPPAYNKQWRVGQSYSMNRNTKGVGAHNSSTYQRIKTVNTGRHNPCTVLEIEAGNKSEKGLHPTQKPVALFEYLIKTYTNPGDLVLDNTMGSATIPVACLNTGRRFIGIELDPDYFAAGCARVRAREIEIASAFTFG